MTVAAERLAEVVREAADYLDAISSEVFAGVQPNAASSIARDLRAALAEPGEISTTPDTADSTVPIGRPLFCSTCGGDGRRVWPVSTPHGSEQTP